MNNPITIALAKGRLAELAIDLLESCGLDCEQVKHPERKLVLYDEREEYRFVLVKPADVPIYVERGVADIGIVGKDTLMEKNPSLYEMLDLGYGRCRLCIAGYPGEREQKLTSYNLRVATKYPHIARSYYGGKGQTIDIIELSGSVELGPLIGLSDVILDIVESGGTLKANGLVVLEEICDISARLVVNRVSLKTKGDHIRPLIEKMKVQLTQQEGGI
jgi:ATP phosphoribosyltransferase